MGPGQRRLKGDRSLNLTPELAREETAPRIEQTKYHMMKVALVDPSHAPCHTLPWQAEAI